ncbi:MAG: hypothetical protein II871_08090 [Clostridia bacterium]|nr:hypothetical protein [Clostridia bacterium]
MPSIEEFFKRFKLEYQKYMGMRGLIEVAVLYLEGIAFFLSLLLVSLLTIKSLWSLLAFQIISSKSLWSLLAFQIISSLSMLGYICILIKFKKKGNVLPMFFLVVSTAVQLTVSNAFPNAMDLNIFAIELDLTELFRAFSIVIVSIQAVCIILQVFSYDFSNLIGNSNIVLTIIRGFLLAITSLFFLMHCLNILTENIPALALAVAFGAATLLSCIFWLANIANRITNSEKAEATDLLTLTKGILKDLNMDNKVSIDTIEEFCNKDIQNIAMNEKKERFALYFTVIALIAKEIVGVLAKDIAVTNIGLLYASTAILFALGSFAWIYSAFKSLIKVEDMKEKREIMYIMKRIKEDNKCSKTIMWE